MADSVENSKKLTAPNGFDGPVKRRCTDPLFMLLLIAAWVAMTAIGIDSVQKGEPERLINGVDTEGKICGVDPGVEKLSKLYYVRLDGTGVCTAECPGETDINNLFACQGADAKYAIGGAERLACSGADAQQCADLTGVAVDGGSFKPNAAKSAGSCMYQIKSVNVLNRCVYTDENIAAAFVDLGEHKDYMQQFMSDIYQARNWILGFGFGFSFVLGFLYCMLLRVPGLVTLLTWTSIFSVIALFAAIGYGFWDRSRVWEDDPANQYESWQINAAKGLGIIGYVLAGLTACLMLYMRKRIALANGIMKESARAINAIPWMIFMPIIEAIAVVCFFVPFVYYGVHLASTGEITVDEDTGIKSIKYSDQIQGRGWYILFCLFWTTEFISAMGQIVVALTIVKFYFSRDKSTTGANTFFSAIKSGLFYHTGTAAFGSLVIAIIQTIRAMIAYAQKKAKATGNKIAQYMLCCCQCCFWCLEKCMKFLNKNAYIQTALFSTSFCKSSKEAFFLIARNIARVGAVSVISEFVIIIMKLVICLATMGATYLGMRAKIQDDLYSLIAPTIFVGVLAYFVAGVFAELFSMTTLTILQCFIADEEMFAPSERFAEGDLREWVDKHGSKGPAASKKTAVDKDPRKKSTAGSTPITATTGTA